MRTIKNIHFDLVNKISYKEKCNGQEIKIKAKAQKKDGRSGNESEAMRLSCEERKSKVEKNIGEKSRRVGRVKALLCVGVLPGPGQEMQLAALRLLATPSSEHSLCIKGPNQIFIVQNQHLYNQYNKCLSVLTRQGANSDLRCRLRVSRADPLRTDDIVA